MTDDANVSPPAPETEVAAAPVDGSSGPVMAEAETAPAETPPAPILQNWAPITQCLDWELGNLAFQARGSQAFTTQEVPNLINQGGLSAYRAAEVLFAHCQELHAKGTLEPEIQCMELAIGLGVHAVQLLDRFQGLCNAHGADFYDRLTFFATDGTPKMIEDAKANGVFDRHAGHVVLGLVNALDPARLVRADTRESVDLTGRLRAVFHTYLLCVLPANLFRRVRQRASNQAGDEAGTAAFAWSVIMARTVLRHPDELAKFTSLTVAELQAMAASANPADKLPLVPLFPLIDLDLALATFDVDAITEGSEIERVAQAIQADLDARAIAADATANGPDELWVLHSAGAVQCLENTLPVLRKDGILLYRDYGPATAERANGNHLYQHYGATTAMGINHFAIDGWLAAQGADGKPRGYVVVPPAEGEAAIKNRLVQRSDLPGTRAAFEKQFDPRAFDALEQAVANARQATAKGGQAMEAYRAALQLERDNWVLLGEAGEIALRRDRHVELAHMLLTEALRINPWYATTTWNNLGDLFWSVQDVPRARHAYEQAVKANPEYYRGYLNLADVFRHIGDHAKAVEMAAAAIARDVDGTDSDRAKVALDDAMKRLQIQRELATKFRRERQAGTPR